MQHNFNWNSFKESPNLNQSIDLNFKDNLVAKYSDFNTNDVPSCRSASLELQNFTSNINNSFNNSLFSDESFEKRYLQNGFNISSLSSDSHASSLLNKQSTNLFDDQSPTLDEVIMMGCSNYANEQYSSTENSPDYVTKLLKAMKLDSTPNSSYSKYERSGIPNQYQFNTKQNSIKRSFMQDNLNLTLSTKPLVFRNQSTKYNHNQEHYICTPHNVHQKCLHGCSNNSSASSCEEAFARQQTNIERVARQHRCAASTPSARATYTWAGYLSRAHQCVPVYSRKVFLGGVPWDITETALALAFRQFGSVRVEWPVNTRVICNTYARGYVYIVFEHEQAVAAMIRSCLYDVSGSSTRYYRISSGRVKSKEVEVIPWNIYDSSYVKTPITQLNSQQTVFVGALHGTITAQALADIMDELFGGVIYAGIDTDSLKYPLGSGRVTFDNAESYMNAIGAAFVELKTPKFSKKVQIDPYLEDALCSICTSHQGPYFCRNLRCFKYYCRTCWVWSHSIEGYTNHTPMMRIKTSR